MTLRLGFVGVGRWSRKLAESFRACGAEVVAHDRKNPSPDQSAQPLIAHVRAVAGFGQHMPWRDQIERKDIDAIVAVAPPEVTTEVALECARQGKAVMATKPLFDHPETIRAPFYVDFWRLWSEAQQQIKGGGVAQIHLKGSGPVRSFSSLFDYGPHVMVAMIDCNPVTLEECFRHTKDDRELFLARYTSGGRGATSFWVEFGNGADEARRSIGCAIETAEMIGDEPRESVIQRMCRAFLADVADGHADPRLLEYSRQADVMLKQIREKTNGNEKP